MSASRLLQGWIMSSDGPLLERCLCLALLLISLGGCNSKPNAGSPPPSTTAAPPSIGQTDVSEPKTPAPVTAASTQTAEAGPRRVAEPKTLFEGWPKPAVALVLTGQQLGYIEPCGCSGLENQKGGL